ncbi:hypothetical protein [Lysobacter gummosus]
MCTDRRGCCSLRRTRSGAGIPAVVSPPPTTKRASALLRAASG